MRRTALAAGLAAALAALPAAAEPLFWSVQVERLEYRFGRDHDALAVEPDAFIGTDALKLRYRGEAEFDLADDSLEVFEHELLLQVPVSDFFDAHAGVRLDRPDGPDRSYAVLGLHGLAPQWIELDLDLFLSDRGDPSARLEAEYEAVITNRLILTPSIELDLPFADDPGTGQGGWAPTLEAGLRLGWDLVDRALAPYVGVHYERRFGETGRIARAGGGNADAVFLVAGVRLMY